MDKINIYLQKDSYEQLINDCTNFEIKKKNNDPNINDFLNRLFSNYISEYNQSLEKASTILYTTLFKSLDTYTNVDLLSLARELAFSKISVQERKGPHDKTISYRINKDVYTTIASELTKIPGEIDYSAFFRSLILSYQTLPVYKREQIIDKKEVEIINEAIKKHYKIAYTNKDTMKTHIFIPHSIEQSKQELFNYISGENDKYRSTSVVRLGNMTKVFIVKEVGQLQPDFNKHLNLMRKNGIQFYITEHVLHKVRMSDKDVFAYNKRYNDRPLVFDQYVDGKGDTIYVFDCSEQQLKSYFYPFSESPSSIIPKHYSIDDIFDTLKYYCDNNKSLQFSFNKKEFSIQFSNNTLIFTYPRGTLKASSLDELIQLEYDEFTVKEMLLSLTEEDIISLI